MRETTTIEEFLNGEAPPGASLICPFHHDTTASAVVGRDSYFLYCYACKYHGSHVRVVRDLYFPDITYLHSEGMARELIRVKNWSSVSLPAREPVSQQTQEETLEVLDRWVHLCAQNLQKQPLLIDRLCRERGLIDPVSLSIGVASPELFYTLISELPQRLLEEDICYRAGLISMAKPDDDRHWKQRYRLYNRWILPEIRTGRAIYYTARSQEAAHPIRYLNPSIPKPLYGMDSLRRPTDHVWLVEGAFDAYPLLEIGESVIASMGTTMAPYHQNELVQALNGRPIILAYDADANIGKDPTVLDKIIAQRTESLEAAGVTVIRFAPIPPYKDLGEWITKRDPHHIVEMMKLAC